MPAKTQSRLAPIHPGEVLSELLAEAGTSPHALALALRIPANRIGAILKGKRGITAGTALRLGRYFGTSPAMWMNLQTRSELAAAEDAIGRPVERDVSPYAAT